MNMHDFAVRTAALSARSNCGNPSQPMAPATSRSRRLGKKKEATYEPRRLPLILPRTTDHRNCWPTLRPDLIDRFADLAEYLSLIRGRSSRWKRHIIEEDCEVELRSSCRFDFTGQGLAADEEPVVLHVKPRERPSLSAGFAAGRTLLVDRLGQ